MSSVFDKLFRKNKDTNTVTDSHTAGSSTSSRKDKLIAEREQLKNDLRETKIVSTNKREEMLDRISEINRILRREFGSSSK